ncbi:MULTISPECIES: thymidine kinase [Bacillales]|uniref:thymidine kinase n=1 Tax=Bacillales TaxID=1385 RepID=UPI003119C3BB
MSALITERIERRSQRAHIGALFLCQKFEAAAPMETKGGAALSAKLYAKLGTMAAGKSLELLKTADTYERTGKRVMILTPAVDTRHGVGKVMSRIGLQRDAIPITEADDIALLAHTYQPDVVLVDESQFLSTDMVKELACGVVDGLDIPVIAFGLKNTFKNELFEGSAALLAYADSVTEIRGLCQYCARKAIMNLRLVDGVPVYEGDTVQIGSEEYISVCRKHYYNDREDKPYEKTSTNQMRAKTVAEGQESVSPSRTRDGKREVSSVRGHLSAKGIKATYARITERLRRKSNKPA